MKRHFVNRLCAAVPLLSVLLAVPAWSAVPYWTAVARDADGGAAARAAAAAAMRPDTAIVVDNTGIHGAPVSDESDGLAAEIADDFGNEGTSGTLSLPFFTALADTAARMFDAVPEVRTGGKLLLTGGVSSVEGSGGGGIATWALTTGYGAADGIGANVHATYVNLPDYEFRSVGVAVGLWDRVELSLARQEFDTGDTGALLGLGQGFTFTQDVVGLKVRVLGDAVYDQDSWLPQVAVGVQHKQNDQGAIVAAVGGRDDEGTEVYVAATKLFLAQSVLVSGAVRWTNANQTGLLGFGGDRNDNHEAQFEGSVGWLVSRNLVVGAEYRTKPDNLGFAAEDDWMDVYAAYALNKHVSLTAAWADLGSIATFEDQRGLYLSLQIGF